LVPTSAYAKIWQIFLAKWFFEDKFHYEGKVKMAAYLFWFMVGLGGLEPPTSPLSG
jgi:hypothetical protein